MGDRLARPAVRRVVDALAANGIEDRVVELEATARTAADAAAAIGVEVGAIVKTLAFVIGDEVVLACVAGDRRCDPAALPTVFARDGIARRADADQVKAATGFSIGGVAPVGHPRPVAITLDTSLGRYPEIYAAAGHPHCVFRTTLAELADLTGGTVSPAIALD
ncbi:MAG: YbaK/EbsC family protein [Pseudomonadota bacterium]